MNNARLTWVIFPAVSAVGLGILLGGRQLVPAAKQTLIVLANGCRDLTHAGPADYLSLLQLNGVSLTAAFWLIGGGVLLFVGGSGVYAIYKNWGFFSILNCYCNLLAESAVVFLPKWLAWTLFIPIKVLFFLILLIFLPIQYVLQKR